MKKNILLSIVLVLLLAGCGKSKDYKLHYESPYLAVAHSKAGENYFKTQGRPMREDGLPVILISSQADYEAFCKALEENFSKETANIFREYFQTTQEGLYTDDLFADWTVAVIYCSETGNAGHILEERIVDGNILRLRYSRVVTEKHKTEKTGWLIPVWLTKVSLESDTQLDAWVAETYNQRYPLLITLGEHSEKQTLLKTASVKDVAVKTYGLSKVEIDFAGEKKVLQTALEEGTITAQQLVMRARIDAAGGLCNIQQYNDGGTVVYIYKDYRLYKIEQITASGTVEGDVWITAPDVELNKIK